jgi:uncharacterized protein YeaO (DUF488 family)
LVHLSESIGDIGLNSLRLLVECHNLCRRLWLKAVQPVKELDQHFQSLLLRSLHRFMRFFPHFLLTRHILELEVLLLERDWVVEEELGSLFENLWDERLWRTFKERYVGELENTKAMLFARVLGKSAERAERA